MGPQILETSRSLTHIKEYFVKGWIVNSLGFARHTVSVTVISLYHCTVKAVINYMWWIISSWLWSNETFFFFLQKQVTDQVWLADHVLLILDLVKKKMELCCTNNIIVSNSMSVNGKLYTLHLENLEVSMLTQGAIITISGITQGNYLESLTANIISSNPWRVQIS